MNHFSCKRTPSPQEFRLRAVPVLLRTPSRESKLSAKKKQKNNSIIAFLPDSREGSILFPRKKKISFDISVLFQEFNTLYELWC